MTYVWLLIDTYIDGEALRSIHATEMLAYKALDVYVQEHPTWDAPRIEKWPVQHD